MFGPAVFTQPTFGAPFGMQTGGMMHLGHSSFGQPFNTMSFPPRAQESARQRASNPYNPSAPLTTQIDKPSPPKLPPIPSPDCPPSLHIQPADDTWASHMDAGYAVLPARKFIQATAWQASGDPSVFLKSLRRRTPSQLPVDAAARPRSSPRAQNTRPLRGPRPCAPIPKPPVVGVDTDSDGDGEHIRSSPAQSSIHGPAGPSRKPLPVAPQQRSPTQTIPNAPNDVASAPSSPPISPSTANPPSAFPPSIHVTSASSHSVPAPPGGNGSGGGGSSPLAPSDSTPICAVAQPKVCTQWPPIVDASRVPAEPAVRGGGRAVIGPGHSGLCELSLRVVLPCGSTGFEATKELEAAVGTVLAGQYEIVAELGRAAFSRAYKAVDRAHGRYVCVKVIVNRKEFFDQSLDEIKLLHYIAQHSGKGAGRVVAMYDYFYAREHLCLVTELLGPSLYDVVLQRPFPLRRLKRVVAQTLTALAHLHTLGLLHCDVKPENVLFEAPTTAAVAAHPPPLHEVPNAGGAAEGTRHVDPDAVKLIDFGSSCFNSDELSSYVQSRSYRAPEVILGLPYDGRIDVFSVGTMIPELVTGGPPLLHNHSIPRMMARIVSLFGPFPPDMLAAARHAPSYFTSPTGPVYEATAGDPSYNGVELLLPARTSWAARCGSHDPVYLDFVWSLCAPDPRERPTAAEALQHPWLAEVRSDFA